MQWSISWDADSRSDCKEISLLVLYKTWKFITMSLSPTKWIQSIKTHPNSLSFVLIVLPSVCKPPRLYEIIFSFWLSILLRSNYYLQHPVITPTPPKFVSLLNVGDQRRTSYFPSAYFLCWTWEIVFLCEFAHCFTFHLYLLMVLIHIARLKGACFVL
jgi:hypothetical protein